MHAQPGAHGDAPGDGAFLVGRRLQPRTPQNLGILSILCMMLYPHIVLTARATGTTGSTTSNMECQHLAGPLPPGSQRSDFAHGGGSGLLNLLQKRCSLQASQAQVNRLPDRSSRRYLGCLLPVFPDLLKCLQLPPALSWALRTGDPGDHM